VHAAHGKSREVNEAHWAAQAEQRARQQLDPATVERLKTLGGGLRHGDIAALAFATDDHP